MTFRRLRPHETPPDNSHWFEVASGLYGQWFAVEMWMNATGEHGLPTFPEPWTTVEGYHKEKIAAARVAYGMAKALDLPFWLPDFTDAQLEGETK